MFLKRFLALMILISPLSAYAGITPQMLIKQKLLCEETFDEAPENKREWFRPVGELSVKNGALNWSNSEAKDRCSFKSLINYAGLNLDQENGIDLILKYDFTINDITHFTRHQLLFSDKYGRNFSLDFNHDDLAIRQWPTPNEPNSFSQYLDHINFKLQPKKTYEVMLEISQQEVLVQLNGEHFLLGSHERLKKAKVHFDLVFRGGQGSLDTIQLWSGRRNPDWPRTILLFEKKRRQHGRQGLDLTIRYKMSLGQKRMASAHHETYKKLKQDIQEKIADLSANYEFYDKNNPRYLSLRVEAEASDPVYQAKIKALKIAEAKEIEFLHATYPELDAIKNQIAAQRKANRQKKKQAN